MPEDTKKEFDKWLTACKKKAKGKKGGADKNKE
jgi:hypothetical protein